MSKWRKIEPGDRFGLLVVVDALEGRTFRVKCDCGVRRPFPGKDLTSGRARSCGCQRYKYRASRSKSGLPMVKVVAMKLRRSTDACRWWDLTLACGHVVPNHMRGLLSEPKFCACLECGQAQPQAVSA